MSIRALVNAAAVACLAASAAGAQANLVVPAGRAPVVDGVAHTGEWAKSLVVHAAGGEILFRHDDRYLYIAIKAAQPGYASVCFANADTVTVLQGPWAVAFGTYLRSDGTYHLARGFDWQLRGNGKGAAEAAARTAYVRANGLLATTLPMNETQKEMQIALDHLPSGPIPISIQYRPSKGARWAWPASAGDACGSPMLIAGVDLASAAFQPARWAQLVIRRASASREHADLLLQ